MLALTRKLHEAVYIGDDLVLSVTRLTPALVQLELEQPDPDFPDRVRWQTVERKPGEVFELAPGIRIWVAEIGKGNVRLGFSLPREIAVVREELVPGTEVASVGSE